MSLLTGKLDPKGPFARRQEVLANTPRLQRPEGLGALSLLDESLKVNHACSSEYYFLKRARATPRKQDAGKPPAETESEDKS